MCSNLYVGLALLGRGGGLESRAAGCFLFDSVLVSSLVGPATELDGIAVQLSLVEIWEAEDFEPPTGLCTTAGRASLPLLGSLEEYG